MTMMDEPGLGIPRGILRWCAWYTRGLEVDMADDRISELASDLHDQRAWANETGQASWRTDVGMLARTVTGIPADLSWRAAAIEAREVDERTFRSIRRFEVVAFVTFLAATALVGSGIYAYLRVARALTDGAITYVPAATISTIALTLTAILGSALLVARKTRMWGSLTLLIPSALLPSAVLSAGWAVSATVQSFVLADLRPTAMGVSVALTALFSFSSFVAGRRTFRTSTTPAQLATEQD